MSPTCEFVPATDSIQHTLGHGSTLNVYFRIPLTIICVVRSNVSSSKQSFFGRHGRNREASVFPFNEIFVCE